MLVYTLHVWAGLDSFLYRTKRMSPCCECVREVKLQQVLEADMSQGRKRCDSCLSHWHAWRLGYDTGEQIKARERIKL